jgi:hypothetical protein
MRRRCSDEEDDAAIVRGATSRASGELSRLWRLETHHQEALTGTTATWGWEAARGSTVSKQTPVFIGRFDLRSDNSYQKQVTQDVSLHVSISNLDVILSNILLYHLVCCFSNHYKTYFNCSCIL